MELSFQVVRSANVDTLGHMKYLTFLMLLKMRKLGKRKPAALRFVALIGDGVILTGITWRRAWGGVGGGGGAGGVGGGESTPPPVVFLLTPFYHERIL